MKVFEVPTALTPYSSTVFNEYFSGCRVGYFDLETTGLSPSRCAVILAGLVLPIQDQLVVRQYFANSPEEEPALLSRIRKDLCHLDLIVTFNGTRFDLPFLNTRLSHHGLPAAQCTGHMDLFRLIRSYSDLRRFLPNLRQKTIENFLGLWSQRTDEIDGAESIRLYRRYLQTQDPHLRDIICLHNRDDILQLYRMMPILKRIEFHRAMRTSGFPAGTVWINEIKQSGDILSISGTQTGTPADYLYYGSGQLEFQFSAASCSFQIRIRLHHHSGLIFADLQELELPSSLFSGDPACYDDLLVLRQHNTVNDRALNRFCRVLTERIQQQWITKKSQH